MSAEQDLLRTITDLTPYASSISEESRRLSIEGESWNQTIVNIAISIVDNLRILGLPNPVIRINSQEVDLDELAENFYDGYSWRLILGKSRLAERFKARNDEDTLLFFSVTGFNAWLRTIDPFIYDSSGNDPDFSRPTTIRVCGLNSGFGGYLLWVLPVDADAPVVLPVAMPLATAVHELIHINAIGGSIRISPQGFALTWGIEGNSAASSLVIMSSRVLSACLIQELKQVDGDYQVILRGTRRVQLSLKAIQTIMPQTLNKLVETVSWVYEEKAETRLKLVMDRLSIDSQDGDNMLICVQNYLDAALQQARDSYLFVILERKDAYHKEMRDLMKDMKSQADLYAVKIRDLVTSFTRDFLGVLVLFGFSFIGKFDQKNLSALLVSDELALLVKFLAGYLMLSFLLQMISHGQDARLAYKESVKWLEVLRNYTSRKDKEESFLALLRKRRESLKIAMIVDMIFYPALILVTWNLPCVLITLL